MSTITLPAGRYIIGDPCYSIPNEQWDEILQQTDCFESPEGSFKSEETGEEIHVVAFGTAYGDGVYTDQGGREYPVDAGLIGIMPAHGVVACESTNVIEFKHDFQCSCHNGVIEFGHIIIDTLGDDTSGDDHGNDDDDSYGDDE